MDGGHQALDDAKVLMDHLVFLFGFATNPSLVQELTWLVVCLTILEKHENQCFVQEIPVSKHGKYLS